MTAGVYATVAGIIKMDDMGAALSKAKGDGIPARLARVAGNLIGHAAPKIIKVIGALGTAAMFVVGGTMLVHGIPGGEHLVSNALSVLGTNPVVLGAAGMAANAVLGIAAGLAAVPVAKVVVPPAKKLFDFAKKQYRMVRPVKQAAVVMPEPLPKPEALKNVPDVKAAVNEAAKPHLAEVKPVFVVKTPDAPKII